MTNHFSYLYEDDESAFFQKQANAFADSSQPRADEIVKTAAPTRTGRESPAERVHRDVHIIKTAGESGVNLGSVMRTTSYMQKFAERTSATPEEFDELYEHMSAEAINHDLAIAQQELYKLASSDEEIAWVDSEIAGAGVDLVEAALMDKEAFVGTAIKAFKATKGMGAVARTKAVVTAPRQAYRNYRAGSDGILSAGAKRSRASKRLNKAKTKLKTMKAKVTARQLATSKLPADLRRNVGPGAVARASKRVDKATAKADKRFGQSDKARVKHVDRKDIAQGKSPRSKQGGGAPAEQRAAVNKQKTKQSANDVKVKDDLKNVTKGPNKSDAGKGGRVGEGTEGAVATVGGSYKKMRDSGWGSLSGAEKQKLINAGVAGVVGHRVVMGQGAVTGGKGIV